MRHDPVHGHTPCHCHAGHGHGADHSRRPAKPGILLAAFGTAVPEARQGYERFEADLRRRYPNIAVAWAYTAHKVRKKLAERGMNHDSLGVALSRLYDQGVTHLAVQSLHTTPGVEYEWTLAQSRAFAHPRKGFESLCVGGPLLVDDQGLRSALAALPFLIPKERKPGEAVVLIGHGTYHQAQARYLDLERAARRDDKLLFMGTLMGRPGLEEVRDALLRAGVRKAWLTPFMAVAGHHVREEICGPDPDSWQVRLDEAGIACESVCAGTLECTAMAAIWRANLEKALEEIGVSRAPSDG